MQLVLIGEKNPVILQTNFATSWKILMKPRKIILFQQLIESPKSLFSIENLYIKLIPVRAYDHLFIKNWSNPKRKVVQINF